MLQRVPSWSFTARLKLAKAASCAPPPAWLSAALGTGALLTFDLLVMQAGRHFSQSLNPAVLPGSGSARRKAANLAWYLIAMLNPAPVSAATPKPKGVKKKHFTPTQESRLVLVKPNDSDIQRLAAEILGVGIGLEVLRSCSFIDARTLKKIHNRFDFAASLKGGTGRVRIEVKGTMNGSSLSKHRRSILAKLGTPNPAFAQSIGLIADLQTSAKSKACDVEVVDPVQDAPGDRDAAIRDIIRHYALIFDEDIAMGRAAQFLWELAAQRQAIEDIPDLTPWVSRIPRGTTREPRFSRASFTIVLAGRSVKFLGGYWESRAVPPPLSVDVGKYPIAYVGVDSDIIGFLRDRRFDELLAYQGPAGVFEFTSANDADVETNPLTGALVVDDDGSVRAWMSRIPQDEILSDQPEADVTV